MNNTAEFNTNSNNSRSSLYPHILRPKDGDHAIRAIAMWIGLFMALFILGCFAEINLRNDGWNESMEKKIKIVVMLALFSLVFLVFIYTLARKVQKVRLQSETSIESLPVRKRKKDISFSLLNA